MLGGVTVIESVHRDVPAAGAPRPRRWSGVLGRTLLAVAGGLAVFAAFPGVDLSPLAVLGPAALSLATRGVRFRTGLWLGLVHGLAFFLPLLSWTGIYVGSFPWLALAVTESLYVAVLGGALASPPGCAAGRCGRRRSGSPTRPCAGAGRWAGSRGGAWASARPRAPSPPSPPTAGWRWSASPSR